MTEPTLETALASFKGGTVEALAEALKKALKESFEDADSTYLVVTDENVGQFADTTASARQVYVLSYARLADYLLKTPKNMKEAEAQASVAHRFIRSAESAGLKALQLGRTKKDDDLAGEVSELRQQVNQMAMTKAKFIEAEKVDE